MSTSTNMEVDLTVSDSIMMLKRQSQLYDLQTHLLGMGSDKFWIDMIIMN